MKFKKHNAVYGFLKKLDDFLNKIAKDPKKVLGVAVLFILGLILITKYKAVLFFVLLNLLAAVSMLYLKISKHAHYVGIELCMMATVLISLKYGAVLGIITGFISLISALIVSGYFKPMYFISIIAMPLIAVFVHFFPGTPLWQLGVMMTFLYDFLVLPIYVYTGSRITSAAVFFVTHMLFNYWVFTTIAPLIFSLM